MLKDNYRGPQTATTAFGNPSPRLRRAHPSQIEALEPRLLLSGGLVLPESIMDVCVPPLDTVVVGDCLTGGEARFFKFTAPASGSVQIEMVGREGGLDSYLEVFNDQVRRIGRNNNARRSVLDSKLRVSVKEGRAYYIRASGWKGSFGAYDLRLTGQAKDDCGNAIATARAIKLNRKGGAAFNGTVNYADDVDVLAFTANQTGTMTVTMTARSRRNPLDGELFAYDASGGLIDYDDDTNGINPCLSFHVVSGQTYYVEAGTPDSSMGAYRLLFSTEIQPDPPPQPDPQPDPQPNPDPQPDPAPGPAPGLVITGQVNQTAGGLQLQVLGTDGNDVITISQTVSDITLTTLSASYAYAGSFASVVIYGFAGSDLIRLDSTVTAAGQMLGGEGADQLFDAGPGSAQLLGEGGDDLLVAVGGGADSLSGGEGTDGFWVDSSDIVTDASATEIAGTCVHRIGQFYQPYTTDPSAPSYVSLEIAGQNLTDPATSYSYLSFAGTPLFVDGPQYNDVAQGAVGDCYFLAALASLADTDPALIRQAVAPLGDGTFAVRFYRSGQEVYLRVDADLPVYYGSSLAYAGVGRDGELWVPIVEKAYAYFRYGQNSYASISGGWRGTVYTEVTNCSSPWRYTTGTAASLYDYLAGRLLAGNAVSMGSYSGASGPIVGSHAYMVKSVQTVDGIQYVTVYNPWGIDGRAWDSDSSDGLLTLTIAQVQQYFQTVAVALV